MLIPIPWNDNLLSAGCPEFQMRAACTYLGGAVVYASAAYGSSGSSQLIRAFEIVAFAGTCEDRLRVRMQIEIKV